MPTKFNGLTTNPNRARAGSEKGIFGRKQPIELAQRLNERTSLLKEVCNLLRRKEEDFVRAVAGAEIAQSVESVIEGGARVKSKTNLRIFWKDGAFTNFRVKGSGSAQIHLELTENFIKGFQAQFKREIPQRVQDALLLFTGRHPLQRQIFESVPVAYVGNKIRALEQKYHNRLTLASLYGYDDCLVPELFLWFCKNMAELFLFCFSLGEVKHREDAPHYLWYHRESKSEGDEEIYSISDLYAKLRKMSELAAFGGMVSPGDAEQIGSTIRLPFGNLQYHLHALQFRHQSEKIKLLSSIALPSGGRKKFGSRQKRSGHENEVMIVAALNKNKRFREHFCERVGFAVSDFVVAEAGGMHAKMEESVICGKKTAGKTDVVVMWKGGYITNISIKKNACGQVYLVTARNFVATYEAQYNVRVPDEVKRALELFVGEALDAKTILDGTDLSVDGFEARQLSVHQNCRLMFDVIKNYDARMATNLLAWLKDRIVTVFELCFSAGAVKDRSSWATLLWYKNLVDADGQGLDYMIPIKHVMNALERNRAKNLVCRGPHNAGSTIQLPFGHLQYHQRQLEFYQKLSKIREIVEMQ